MTEDRILIIDDDAETAESLAAVFAEAGVATESVRDAFAAMEKLRERSYCAVILDPMIRHRLNGYVVLNFLELEQPEMLDRLFLFTGMSEQTIRRTAPSVFPRLFRKPSASSLVAAAVIEACIPRAGHAARQHRNPVLLVEDDHATAGATIHLLNELGYAAQWARNGREALSALATREFDAILLDLVMPDVDGFMLLDYFHAERAALLRRVIVITGMPGKYLEALDVSSLGGTVRKPLDVRRLEHLLANCACGRLAQIEPGGELP
jgi:DNA-binding response OmpR family regulator